MMEKRRARIAISNLIDSDESPDQSDFSEPIRLLQSVLQRKDRLARKGELLKVFEDCKREMGLEIRAESLMQRVCRWTHDRGIPHLDDVEMPLFRRLLGEYVDECAASTEVATSKRRKRRRTPEQMRELHVKSPVLTQTNRVKIVLNNVEKGRTEDREQQQKRFEEQRQAGEKQNLLLASILKRLDEMTETSPKSLGSAPDHDSKRRHLDSE